MAATPSPLLQLAARQDTRLLPATVERRAALRRAERAVSSLQIDPGQCPGSLGAERYAALYRDLAGAREALGDPAGALAAIELAISCEPRNVEHRSSRVWQLIRLDRWDEAGQQVLQALAIRPELPMLNALSMGIDFGARRWNAAAQRARTLAAADTGSELELYAQLFLLLTETRTGSSGPRVEARRLSEGWPRPVLRHLLGELDEAALADEIARLDSAALRRERLAEALFYTGERLLGEGQRDAARQRLAMAMTMRSFNLLEHDLARRELAALRAGTP